VIEMKFLTGTLVSPDKMLVQTAYNLDHPANAGIDTSLGVVVEAEAESPAPQPGKGYCWFVNPQTGEQWFEEYDRPLTLEEQLMILKQQIDQTTILLGDLILGGGS
jgi:hypothetical protein